MSKIYKVIIVVVFAVIMLGAGTGCQKPATIRVLSYNIYHGENMEGGSNLDAVAELIKQLQPDLVALQEVDQNTARAKGLDLTAELSKRTGMTGIFGKAMDFSGGGYGEAVLTPHKIVRSTTHALPHTPRAEPRAALEVVIALPDGRKVTFVGTHLDHWRDEKNRLMQVEELNNIYAKQKQPAILAGDLNAQPDSETMKQLLEQWTDSTAGEAQPTFPSVHPKIKIDYVLYRPAKKWQVLETRVIEGNRASDHCPVLVVLQLSD